MKVKPLLKLRRAVRELGVLYVNGEEPSKEEMGEAYERISETWYKSKCIELRANLLRESCLLAQWEKENKPRQAVISLIYNTGKLLDLLEEQDPDHKDIKICQRKAYLSIGRVVRIYEKA